MFYFTEKKHYSQKAINTYKKIASISKNKSDKIKVLVVRLNYKIEKNFLKNFKNLKFIISNTTGLDHIDRNYCENNNIKILSLNDTKEKMRRDVAILVRRYVWRTFIFSFQKIVIHSPQPKNNKTHKKESGQSFLPVRSYSHTSR